MTRKRHRTARGRLLPHSRPSAGTPTLRIIGGRFGGRKILYRGDRRTRPMKDRVREAIFNLIGPAVRGKHAIDPFAGTGALGLEAISRGAARATMVEQHFPTAGMIRENIRALAVEDRTEVVAGDAFFWAGRLPDLGRRPWVVFCCPPYDFYVDRTGDMLRLIGALLEAAPPESIFVVEADDRFDFGLLPRPAKWDIRRYLPAVVGILRLENAMDIQNIEHVAAFTTKDGSEIRELLSHRNSRVRNQSLAEARLAAGTATTPHYHAATEEIYYILEGAGRMKIGREVHHVGPGDAVAIPPGEVHQIANIGTEVLRFLCCCAPPYEDEDTMLSQAKDERREEKER